MKTKQKEGNGSNLFDLMHAKGFGQTHLVDLPKSTRAKQSDTSPPEKVETRQSTTTEKTYVISKGLRLPPKQAGRKMLYPFRELEVGESFFVAESENPTFTQSCRVPGRKFATRAWVENGVKGVRCFRVM